MFKGHWFGPPAWGLSLIKCRSPDINFTTRWNWRMVIVLYWQLPQLQSGQKRTLIKETMSSLSGEFCILICSTFASYWRFYWHDWFYLFRFEAKGGASVKQQDAKRKKVANGFVKKRKNLDKKTGVLEKTLIKLLQTCKANGLSLAQINEIVNETFEPSQNWASKLFQIVQNFNIKETQSCPSNFMQHLNLNSSYFWLPILPVTN